MSLIDSKISQKCKKVLLTRRMIKPLQNKVSCITLNLNDKFVITCLSRSISHWKMNYHSSGFCLNPTVNSWHGSLIFVIEISYFIYPDKFPKFYTSVQFFETNTRSHIWTQEHIEKRHGITRWKENSLHDQSQHGHFNYLPEFIGEPCQILSHRYGRCGVLVFPFQLQPSDILFRIKQHKTNPPVPRSITVDYICELSGNKSVPHIKQLPRYQLMKQNVARVQLQGEIIWSSRRMGVKCGGVSKGEKRRSNWCDYVKFHQEADL